MSDFVDFKITIDTTEAQDALSGLQDQADRLLATLEKCKGACADCRLKATVSITAADLAAEIKAQDYRTLRTSAE